MTTKPEQDEFFPTPAQSLQDNGMYVFMGEVDNESIQPIIEWILHENHVRKK